MSKKLLLILGLFIAVLSANAQLYTTVDKDGYTNIREKPTASSKIIDRVLQYEVIFSANYFCDNDFSDTTLSPNWTAVKKDWATPVGYIYNKNLRVIDSMPILYQDDKLWSADSVICANDTLSVLLTLKPFDINSHKVEYVEEYDYKYVRSVDGEFPKGFLMPYSEPAPKNREIATFTVTINNKVYNLLIDVIKSFYNPHMVVFIGDEGDLYISISCGDGGEGYSIMLSVINGKIRHSKPSEAC